MKGLILAAIAALALLIGPAVVATAQVVTSIPPSCWTGSSCSSGGSRVMDYNVTSGGAWTVVPNTTFQNSVNFGNAAGRGGGLSGGSDGAHFQVNGGNGSLVLDTRVTHILTQFATAPLLTSCGTSPTVVTGTDISGQFTTGTATPTSCTLTFNTAYTAAPACLVEDTTARANLTSFTTSTTTIVITTAAASSQKIMYQCIGTS